MLFADDTTLYKPVSSALSHCSGDVQFAFWHKQCWVPSPTALAVLDWCNTEGLHGSNLFALYSYHILRCDKMSFPTQLMQCIILSVLVCMHIIILKKKKKNTAEDIRLPPKLPCVRHNPSALCQVMTCSTQTICRCDRFYSSTAIFHAIG